MKCVHVLFGNVSLYVTNNDIIGCLFKCFFNTGGHWTLCRHVLLECFSYVDVDACTPPPISRPHVYYFVIIGVLKQKPSYVQSLCKFVTKIIVAILVITVCDEIDQ